MGAVSSVRKLTVDSIALLELLEPNSVELAAKRAVRRRVQQLLKQQWPTCRILPFGSSESGLGFGGCDIDLGIYFEDVNVDVQGQFSPQKRVDLLTTACEQLSGSFQVQKFVRNARVPVLKLWDAKRQIACDLCVGGVNALLNTALLKFYGQVNPRVRPLVFAVKYWAKQRGINDSVNGTLSSYGYTLLLIFYLQSHYAKMQLPAVHSNFHDLQSHMKVSELLQRLQSLPRTELASTFGRTKPNSVGALLAGFFDYYAHRFNLEDEVVSVRIGSALSKTTKWSRPVSWRLSIEDPFELAHDVGRVMFHRKGQDLIRSEFKRASDLLSEDHRLEDICVSDETSWNHTATCYICCGRDHATRECGRLVRQHSTPGGACNAMSLFSDCWYCGEYGHYKAECPMLFFRNIPISAKKKETISIPGSGLLTEIALSSRPDAVCGSLFQGSYLFACARKFFLERGLSRSDSPMLRLSRRKKRSHSGYSLSTPAASPSSSWHWSSNSFSQAEKRRQQQRYHQQRQEQRRQKFCAIYELPRKCGGSNSHSCKSQARKVLCPS